MVEQPLRRQRPYKIRTYVPHEVVVLDANPARRKGADAENHPDQKRARSGRAPLADRAGRCRYRAQHGADQMAALKGKPGVKPWPFLTLRFISCSSTPRRHRRSAIRRSGKRRWLFDYKGIADDLLKGQFQSHQAFLPDGYLGALRISRTASIRKKPRDTGQSGAQQRQFPSGRQQPAAVHGYRPGAAGQLCRGGVKVELVPGISSQVSTKVKALNYDATLTSRGRIISTLTPMPQPSPTTRKTAARRWLARQLADPALSKLTLAATAENDTAKRVADYQQLQKQVQQSSPFVIGLQARSLIAVRDNLKGYVQGINPDMVFYSKVSK